MNIGVIVHAFVTSVCTGWNVFSFFHYNFVSTKAAKCLKLIIR